VGEEEEEEVEVVVEEGRSCGEDKIKMGGEGLTGGVEGGMSMNGGDKSEGGRISGGKEGGSEGGEGWEQDGGQQEKQVVLPLVVICSSQGACAENTQGEISLCRDRE